MKYLVKIIILAVIIAGGVWLLTQRDRPKLEVVDFHTCLEAGNPVMESYPRQCKTPDGRNFTEQFTQQSDVIVDQPQPNDLVTSPMTVKGRARGSWYFEANLPVALKDSNGNILVQKGMHAQTDWMTTNYVDFQDTLTFSMPPTQYGELVISKDNPSGEPQNDAQL